MYDTMILVFSAVFAAGCFGGFITGLFDNPSEKLGVDGRNAKKHGLSYKHGKCRFPGLLGQVLLGGVGAVVFWSLYGPFSGETIIGPEAACEGLNLTLGQLATSLLIGMGGTGFLWSEAERRCCFKSKDDDSWNKRKIPPWR